jgi:hypothetical protein
MVVNMVVDITLKKIWVFVLFSNFLEKEINMELIADHLNFQFICN